MEESSEQVVFHIKFPYTSKKTVESTFDTCIWFSKIFQESLLQDFKKKHQGKEALKLIEKYSDDNQFLTVLDTVSWEFSEIVTKKVENLYSFIINSLNETKKRVNEGEEEKKVVKEISKRLEQDPHYNSVYSYFQIRGKGFPIIYSNKQARIEFFKELFSLSWYAQENFNVLTRKYPKRFVKESIMLWINKYNNLFFQFKKEAKKIDKKDRFHILGSIMCCYAKKRTVDFITFDQSIYNCSGNVIGFIVIYKKKLQKQFSTLPIEEAISF